MRSLFFASVAVLALAPFAYAQSVDTSSAGGQVGAAEGSVASSMGNGAALSGGIEDSQVASFDLSGSIAGHNMTEGGTAGATDVQTSGLTASTSSGHASGSALGGAEGTGGFGGTAAEGVHHH